MTSWLEELKRLAADEGYPLDFKWSRGTPEEDWIEGLEYDTVPMSAIDSPPDTVAVPQSDTFTLSDGRTFGVGKDPGFNVVGYAEIKSDAPD